MVMVINIFYQLAFHSMVLHPVQVSIAAKLVCNNRCLFVRCHSCFIENFPDPGIAFKRQHETWFARKLFSRNDMQVLDSSGAGSGS
jgi:hypothetical protein